MKRLKIPKSSLYGHRLLDAQHQGLFDILEMLSTHVDQNVWSEINTLFDSFLELLITHCRDEEKVMTVTGYPCIVAHSHHHIELAKLTRELIHSVRSDGRLTDVHIHKFADKILRHMLVADGDFNTFLYQTTKNNTALKEHIFS